MSRGKNARNRRPKTAAAAQKPAQAASPAAGPAVMPASPPDATRRRLVSALLLVTSFAGFVLSMYLTLVHYRGYVSPCYVVHGCETVQTSRFSSIAGVPVALLGTVFFTVMFYLSIALLTGTNARLTRVYKGLSFVGALTVIPLFLLQAIVLQAFCSYCIATEVLMLALWIGGLMLPSPEQVTDGAGDTAPAAS